MTHIPSPPAPSTSRIYYGEAISEEAALLHISNLRGDGWRVLASPFLVDSKRVTLYRMAAESFPISSTNVDIWAYLLHRFFYD